VFSAFIRERAVWCKPLEADAEGRPGAAGLKRFSKPGRAPPVTEARVPRPIGAEFRWYRGM